MFYYVLKEIARNWLRASQGSQEIHLPRATPCGPIRGADCVGGLVVVMPPAASSPRPGTAGPGLYIHAVIFAWITKRYTHRPVPWTEKSEDLLGVG